MRFNYEEIYKRTINDEILKRIEAIRAYNLALDDSINYDLALDENVAASSRLDGLDIDQARVKELRLGSEAKDSGEGEVLGLLTLYEEVFENYQYIPLNRNYILQFHKEILDRAYPGSGGYIRRACSYIQLVDEDGNTDLIPNSISPYEVGIYLDQMVEAYRQAVDMGLESLVLIPIFVVDFANINVFDKASGRVLRLLVNLLLLKASYRLVGHGSLDLILEKSWQDYQGAFLESSQGWEVGSNSYQAFLMYFLEVLEGLMVEKTQGRD